MYFILSKVLLFLISPIYWIVILLLIAAFTKRKRLRQKTATFGLLLAIVCSSPYLYNLFAHSWEWPRTNLPENAHYSCAIVLGGFAGQSKGKEGHFGMAADRFIQGMKLQVTGKVSHILISGGNGNLIPGAFSEGEWARGQLKEFKFADSTIVIEGKSRNTLENAKFSAVLLQKKGLKPPYVLVTSAFHMRRALMIFKKAGVDVIPYPADFRTRDDGFTIDQLFPDFETIGYWGLNMKEMCGYVVNYLMN